MSASAETVAMQAAVHGAFRESRGACMLASALLAKRLSDSGTEAAVVNGVYDLPGRRGFHSWVRAGELLLDPTRDQFDDGPLVSRADEDAARHYLEQERVSDALDAHLVRTLDYYRAAGGFYADAAELLTAGYSHAIGAE